MQGLSSEAIVALGDAKVSTEDKLRVAKQLKNVIVGQDQRKELAVKNGVVYPLTNIISSTTKATGKRRVDVNGLPLHQSQEWTPDDELRLQAVLIIGSLAAGGHQFLAPLCAGGAPQALVDALSPELPPRLTVAILQAIKTLAIFSSANDEDSNGDDLWPTAFTLESVATFDSILRQPNSSLVEKSHLRLVADIISALPESAPAAEATKALLVNCGLLDTLASLLVAHAIESRIVLYRGDTSQLPPAPPQPALPSILSAIAATISGSNYRTHRFILAPCVQDLLLQAGTDTTDQRAMFGARHGFNNGSECLLPPLHIPTYKTVSHTPSSNNFPALKTLSNGKQSKGSEDLSRPINDIDHANAVVGWLLVLTRSMRGLNRLAALRLLALVANAIDTEPVGSSTKTEFQQKTRERQRQVALLAVPLAVQLVEAGQDGRGLDATDGSKDTDGVREQACAVLAQLIAGSKELQIAAVEAQAIKHVCPILKKSFDSVSLAKPMWLSRSTTLDTPTTADSCRLGVNALPPEISHAMRCRYGALKALAALAAKEDVHRKAIIEHGVVSCIIDSLKPFPPSVLANAGQNRASITPKDGNTTAVVLAACRAAQSMSRSVSVLRTSLIDGGIAKPLIQLLHHASLDVQIAATDVCCNLLPDFSPMRDDLSHGNVVKMLVEHARCSSPALRLSSMWALKHLVYACPKEVKLSTLEELGTGWLVGIIQGEQQDATPVLSGGGVSVGLSTPNAAGEQVDLLNPSSMDVDEPGADADDMVEDDEDEDGEVMYDEASSTHYQSSHMRSTLDPPVPVFNSKRYLSSIREMEQNDEYAARRDEASIQQQGLDFLRNVINGDDCGALTDHIMNQIGSAKVYELLTAKLSPLPRSSSSARPIYNTTELVLSTIHVIIHLANASAKHRQMLIAQKPLLQAMLPHFNHVDHRVRVMCVWAVNSLTWIEEDGDRRDARQRSNELKAVGIEQAVRALTSDPNLDVRERVKTAIRQFDTL